jgi:hypothetical protein
MLWKGNESDETTMRMESAGGTSYSVYKIKTVLRPNVAPTRQKNHTHPRQQGFDAGCDERHNSASNGRGAGGSPQKLSPIGMCAGLLEGYRRKSKPAAPLAPR